MLRLPIETDVSIDVLTAKPGVYLGLDGVLDVLRMDLAAGMAARGLDKMWHILIQDEWTMCVSLTRGNDSIALLKQLLHARGLQLGMFPELRRAIVSVVAGGSPTGMPYVIRMIEYGGCDSIGDLQKIMNAGLRTGLRARDIFTHQTGGIEFT